MDSSYSFTTIALDVVEWSASRSGPALLLGKGGWVDPRASADTEVRRKILLPLLGIDPHHPVLQSIVRNVC
jgi:hypothetical protein